MDKYAAEKIAQEFYAMGSQEALEKLASASLLTSEMAKNLAQAAAGDIAWGAKQMSGNPIKRFSRFIPGTKANTGRRILNSAAGKANMDYAQQAANLGFGAGGRPVNPYVGGLIDTYPSIRARQAFEQGLIPSQSWRTWEPRLQRTLGVTPIEAYVNPSVGLPNLSEHLAQMPSEAALRGIK